MSRGRHLFQTIVQIPDLESVSRWIYFIQIEFLTWTLSSQADREQIIAELCQRFKTNKLNYKKFSNLTEGYTIGDLKQFLEKAVFYAYRAGM